MKMSTEGLRKAVQLETVRRELNSEFKNTDQFRHKLNDLEQVLPFPGFWFYFGKYTNDL